MEQQVEQMNFIEIFLGQNYIKNIFVKKQNFCKNRNFLKFQDVFYVVFHKKSDFLRFSLEFSIKMT